MIFLFGVIPIVFIESILSFEKSLLGSAGDRMTLTLMIILIPLTYLLLWIFASMQWNKIFVPANNDDGSTT